ncbi:MAG: hypothetical protein P8Y78_13965, partial [Acidihalobacter sp.]
PALLSRRLIGAVVRVRLELLALPATPAGALTGPVVAPTRLHFTGMFGKHYSSGEAVNSVG